MVEFINLKTILNATKDITLIAVSKYQQDVDVISLQEHGIACFGENKVQDFLNRYSRISDVNWHFIGQLQTNKVKDIIGKVSLIQSLDSIKLANEINKQSANMNTVSDCLIQLDYSNQTNRGGVSLGELPMLYDYTIKLPNIRVCGFMVVAPILPEPQIKSIYLSAHQVFCKYQAIDSSIKHLSMGMSNDYQLAINCGATMVRVGQKLFEKNV